MRTFDATVDFDTAGALEAALTAALGNVAPGTVFTVIIFADCEDCETGRIYIDDENLPETNEDDFVVTGTNIAIVAKQLRALV